jgi:hypothetical protein
MIERLIMCRIFPVNSGMNAGTRVPQSALHCFSECRWRDASIFCGAPPLFRLSAVNATVISPWALSQYFSGHFARQTLTFRVSFTDLVGSGLAYIGHRNSFWLNSQLRKFAHQSALEPWSDQSRALRVTNLYVHLVNGIHFEWLLLVGV